MPGQLRALLVGWPPANLSRWHFPASQIELQVFDVTAKGIGQVLASANLYSRPTLLINENVYGIAGTYYSTHLIVPLEIYYAGILSVTKRVELITLNF